MERRDGFPPQVRAQVTAMACTLPQQSGVPLTRWSHAELRRQMVASMPDQKAPSSRTVGRWLKAERLRPWRSQNWQHLHNREPFLERARPVLQFYAQALS